ncbi:hypothetical protein B0H11DRAFT_1901643 [Mycena galericulata]|nr:hypothetical protein B0H11DRAFT_1901643 [Mycena galericulata]
MNQDYDYEHRPSALRAAALVEEARRLRRFTPYSWLADRMCAEEVFRGFILQHSGRVMTMTLWEHRQEYPERHDRGKRRRFRYVDVRRRGRKEKACRQFIGRRIKRQVDDGGRAWAGDMTPVGPHWMRNDGGRIMAGRVTTGRDASQRGGGAWRVQRRLGRKGRAQGVAERRRGAHDNGAGAHDNGAGRTTTGRGRITTGRGRMGCQDGWGSEVTSGASGGAQAGGGNATSREVHGGVSDANGAGAHHNGAGTHGGCKYGWGSEVTRGASGGGAQAGAGMPHHVRYMAAVHIGCERPG